MSLAAKIGTLFGAGGAKINSAHIDVNSVPVGAIVPFSGASAPSGYIFCYGQAVSRTTYAALFIAISTAFGVGDGSTTFNLPDLRGRVAAGKDDMGGTSANRLTSPINGDVLGAAGGVESHALSSAELAAHTHGPGTLATNTTGAHTHTTTAGTNSTQQGTGSGSTDKLIETSANTGSAGDHTHTLTGFTASAGTGTAHPNVQPTLVLNYIIKT